MIRKIKGTLREREEARAVIESGYLFYEISIPKTVYAKLEGFLGREVELIIYHYFQLDQSRGVPVLIAFTEELEREFFEKFITVSGIGPKAALRAFDRPVPLIARAIEEGDVTFLKGLVGIGAQRAKQIVASLQGKVGRFALIQEEELPVLHDHREIAGEAKQVLKRLQYKAPEIEAMIKKALETNKEIRTVEELLNEIYRQRR